METGLIYKITSKTTNLSYIGKTLERCFERRMYQHANDDSNTYFAKIKKEYGWNDFEVEILESGIPEDEMSDREIYWIGYYNTFNEGYNCTIGGNGGNTYAKKTEEEMSLIKQKISKANSGSNNGNKGQYVGELNGMYGKHHTEEAKQAMRDKLKGVKKPEGHGAKVSEAFKGKPKNYINYGKTLYIKKGGVVEPMKAYEIVNRFNIENYIELKRIVDNKILIDGYEISESVETTENIL